jgi:hypothetical protein
LLGGLSVGPEGRARPELLAEHAAALGRQLMLDGVPVSAIQALVRELEAAARLGAEPPVLRARLSELASRPAMMRHAMLAQLLAAATPHVKRPADWQALVAHLKRAAMLAGMSQALVGMSLVSMKRAKRAGEGRRSRPTR